MTDREEAGKAVYAQSFGVSAREVVSAITARVGVIYAEEAIRAAGGPAWNDPTVSDHDRSLVVLTALICEGVLGERLEAHLERAVRAGLEQHALEVLVVLLSLYVGQAKTSIAAEEIKRFFEDRAERAGADRRSSRAES